MGHGRRAKKKETKARTPLKPVVWLKVSYHFHVFHYRMPGTVAIAAMTPFVPSPLTVKMAMIAALLQKGEAQKAKDLAPHLPLIEVRINPPSAAFPFKAFLRYRSVPAVESAGNIDESGSYYPSRPHTREYALFADDLTIFVGLPTENIKHLAEEALQNIRYLGCKDSQVWCREIHKVETLPDEVFVTKMSKRQAGTVYLLDDFNPDAKLTLESLIPGQRRKKDFQGPQPYVLPGHIKTRARTRIFIKNRE